MSNFYQIILENITLEGAVIIVIAIIMFWFAWQDFHSHAKKNYKDFKSIIVSTGVLGTFIGIFIGLWGFDSTNISNSVPQLLEGLKLAFITSIIGMFLAVLLAVIQKIKEVGNFEDEITVLNNINKQLENLNNTTEKSKLNTILNSINEKLTTLDDIKKHNEILPRINTKLDSIDTNIKILSSNISSVKEELGKNQNILFNFLQKELKTINDSLKEAVETLAEGATEEIIDALNKVMKDFNNNLVETFGDNFKKLNESVLKMIKWQNNYKDAIEQFEKSLKATLDNTENSNKQTIKLINTSFADFMKSNQKAINITIEQIKTTNKTTSEQLQLYTQTLLKTVKNSNSTMTSTIQEQAKLSMENNKATITLIKKTQQEFSEQNKQHIQDLTKDIKKTSAATNQALKENIKQHKDLNKDLQEGTKGILVNLENSSKITLENSKQIKSMTKHYESILKISKDLEEVIKTNQRQIQDLETHLKNLAKIGEDAGTITKELADFSKNIQGSLSAQGNTVATLTKEIQDKLPPALISLERTLVTLTQDFAKNYQAFLDRFNEIKQRDNE